MARPKNTRTTKWKRWSDSWEESRAEAIATAKHSKFLTSIEHRPHAKTPYGNYRKNKWLVMRFYPTMYRGRKVITHPFENKTGALKAKKYHPNQDLVQIRGCWVYLGEQLTHARRKR